MKRISITLSILGGGFVGLILGYLLGWRNGAFQMALWENKVAAANLKFDSTNLTSQLSEYLKARVYCNIYTYYPDKEGYLLKRDWDFGQVDRSALSNLVTYKEGMVATNWESAIANKRWAERRQSPPPLESRKP